MAVGHYENFPVASSLLPARYRDAVVAIYRFARAADDIADEGDAAPGERLAALAAFGRAIDAIERGDTPAQPPFPSVAAAIRTHRLPLAPFRALLAAFAQDVEITRYETFDAVLDYCSRSANPVGRLLLALYGVDNASSRLESDAICTALQLTNFWQDVAVDWRKGRVYLPLEDLARFGIDTASIAERKTDARWSRLMAYETARTRLLFDAGARLPGRLPFRAGLELRAISAGGRRILDRIDRVRGDVFNRRPVLDWRDWCVVSWRTLLPLRVASTSS